MPKIFGLEVKPWMIWVAGGAAVLVLLMMMRRGSGQAVPIPSPQPDYGGLGGGGGGGVAGPAYTEQPDVIPEELDEFTRQLQELTLEERRTELSRRQAMYELEQEQQSVLAQLWTGLAGSQAELERERIETALIAESGVQKAAQRKADKGKVECPPGEHLVITPEGGAHCQPLGRSSTSGRAISQRAARIVTDYAGAWVRSYLGGAAAPAATPQRQERGYYPTPPIAPTGRQVASTGRIQAGSSSDPGPQLYDPYTRESVYG